MCQECVTLVVASATAAPVGIFYLINLCRKLFTRRT